jgi:hypothetical protein
MLPSSQGTPIHIIMERSTGKTMDCYVEFPTERQAKETVDRLSRAYDSGSAPRMGSRHVDIEMSSPAKLLKAIFPLAKCISWETGSPVQLENKDDWSTGFNGFLTDEELYCLTRHAEQPHRVGLTFISLSFYGRVWLTQYRVYLPARCHSAATNHSSPPSGR